MVRTELGVYLARKLRKPEERLLPGMCRFCKRSRNDWPTGNTGAARAVVQSKALIELIREE